MNRQELEKALRQAELLLAEQLIYVMSLQKKLGLKPMGLSR